MNLNTLSLILIITLADNANLTLSLGSIVSVTVSAAGVEYASVIGRFVFLNFDTSFSNKNPNLK